MSVRIYYPSSCPANQRLAHLAQESRLSSPHQQGHAYYLSAPGSCPDDRNSYCRVCSSAQSPVSAHASSSPGTSSSASYYCAASLSHHTARHRHPSAFSYRFGTVFPSSSPSESCRHPCSSIAVQVLGPWHQA